MELNSQNKILKTIDLPSKVLIFFEKLLVYAFIKCIEIVKLFLFANVN